MAVSNILLPAVEARLPVASAKPPIPPLNALPIKSDKFFIIPMSASSYVTPYVKVCWSCGVYITIESDIVLWC